MPSSRPRPPPVTQGHPLDPRPGLGSVILRQMVPHSAWVLCPTVPSAGSSNRQQQPGRACDTAPGGGHLPAAPAPAGLGRDSQSGSSEQKGDSVTLYHGSQAQGRLWVTCQQVDCRPATSICDVGHHYLKKTSLQKPLSGGDNESSFPNFKTAFIALIPSSRQGGSVRRKVGPPR